MRQPVRGHVGFTLLETLIVLAILGLVLGLSMPVWSGLLDRARPGEAASLIEEGTHAARVAARDKGLPAALIARGDRLVVVAARASANEAGSTDDAPSEAWSAPFGFEVSRAEASETPGTSADEAGSDAAFFDDATFAAPSGPAASASASGVDFRLAVVAPDGTVWAHDGVEIVVGEDRLTLSIDAWTGRVRLDAPMSGTTTTAATDTAATRTTPPSGAGLDTEADE